MPAAHCIVICLLAQPRYTVHRFNMYVGSLTLQDLPRKIIKALFGTIIVIFPQSDPRWWLLLFFTISVIRKMGNSGSCLWNNTDQNGKDMNIYEFFPSMHTTHSAVMN